MQRKAIGKSGVFAIAAITLSLMSCGPMNPKAGDSTVAPLSGGCQPDPSLNSNVSPAALATNFSMKRAFLVQAQVKNPNGSGYAAHPVMGENHYVIKVLHVDDFNAASKNADVTVQFTRTKSHTHIKYDAKVARQEDGSFLATLEFKKAGSWNIEIHVADGDKKDDHVFTTTF